MACGSKESYPPFPFPPGQAGAGMVPPTPEARRAPAKSAGTHRCCRLPPQEGCRPLVHPPLASGILQNRCGEREHSSIRLKRTDGDSPRRRTKDGRHVGLDFYDLLIEPIMFECISRVGAPGIERLRACFNRLEEALAARGETGCFRAAAERI